MYNYLIVYAHPGGAGNIDMPLRSPVDSITKVRVLEQRIADQHPELGRVAITNLILLSGPES